VAARRASEASDGALGVDVIESWVTQVANRIIGDAPTLDGKLRELSISLDDLYELLQHETIEYPELVPILRVWADAYERNGHVSLDDIAQRAGWKAAKFNGLIHEILYAYDVTETDSLVAAMRPVIVKRSLLGAMTDADERERWMQRFGYFTVPKSQALVGDTNVNVNVSATADAKAGSVVASNLPFLRDDLDRTQKLTRGKRTELTTAPDVIDIAAITGDDSKSCSASRSSRRRKQQSSEAT
jgi:hypothetical protein